MTFFGGNLLRSSKKVRFCQPIKTNGLMYSSIDDITIEERLLQLPDINANFHL
jgi:hypothetical protein